jgi:hypothetical protein
MFYEQFADEGDNTNLYMVDADNRSSPGLQLVVFLSSTKQNIHVLSIIKVITKLPNSEQSYKGKVKTHNYINRQNQSTTGKL